MPGWVETPRRIIDAASNICNVISQFFAGIMIFLVAADAVGRYLFNHPIPGTLEITEIMMVFIVFLAFAYVQSKDGHVRVDLITSRLPLKAQIYIDCIGAVISFCIMAMISWQSVLYSLELWQSGNVSSYWGMPISPFLLVMAFGCLLFCLQLLLKILSLVTSGRNSK